MTGIRLGYVIIYVENVPATVAFYQKAFNLKQRFLHESKQYAEMETGQTCLAFSNEEFIKDSHSFQPNRKDKPPAGAEVAFIVEDVSMAYAHAVEEGAIPVLKPEQKPWGQTVSYVRDNNGFTVEICDELKG